MVWIAVAAAGVAVVGFGLKVLFNRTQRDLDKGSVSQSWIVEHRADRDMGWK